MIGQDEVISLFLSTLQHDGASFKTQKSYIADLKDFFLWLNLKSERIQNTKAEIVIYEILKRDIEEYLGFLLKNFKSIATVNRRLSTLRVFFSYWHSIGKCIENPTIGISNVNTAALADPAINEALSYWKTHLTHRGIDQEIQHQQMNLIRDFLHWKKHKETPSR